MGVRGTPHGSNRKASWSGCWPDTAYLSICLLKRDKPLVTMAGWTCHLGPLRQRWQRLRQLGMVGIRLFVIELSKGEGKAPLGMLGWGLNTHEIWYSTATINAKYNLVNYRDELCWLFKNPSFDEWSYTYIFGLVEKLTTPAYLRPEALGPGCMLESPGKVLKHTDAQVKPLPNQIRESGGGSLGRATEKHLFHVALKWNQSWEPLF